MLEFSPNDSRGQIKETSAGKFEADPTIIKSIVSARAVYAKLRGNHLKRIAFFTEAEGLIQGNPPYDPAEMQAAGLQHVANFNDMSPRAVYERFCQAYFNLLYSSEFMCNFILRVKDPQAIDFARSMACNWDVVIKKYWPSFHINVASLTAQLVKIGISPALFYDERDPRWRVVEYPKFFVPDQAQSDLDLMTTMLVETEFTIQYLWEIYKEFKDKPKDSTPWNCQELGRVLVWLANSPMREALTPYDLAELERKVYSGDITFDRMYNDTVRIVSMFQKEFDGKISHYMFHRVMSFEAAADEAVGSDFIYFQHNQYQDMREALVLFTQNPGEYTIHANRGLVHKIYSLAQAKMMADCSLVDMMRWAATPLIKSNLLNPKDVDQIRFYPGVPTNIGSADFIQNNLGANVQNVVTGAEYLSSLMQYNLTYSGSDPASPDPSTGSISPSQVRLLAFKEFSVLKNYIMHFYSTFDRILQNMTAKMLKSKEGWPMYDMAAEWKERCLFDDVPKEVFHLTDVDEKWWGLPRHLEVYATRAAGSGSQVAMLIGLQELQSIAGSFNEDEEREFKKLFVSATVGPEYLETFAQPPRPDETRGGSSLAGVENAVMLAGQSPVFSLDNEHREHFTTHYALLRNTVQQIQQQQMDVIQADSIFTVAIPHTAEHLNALSNNPFAEQFYQQAKPAFDEIARFAALNKKNAERAVEAKIKTQQDQQANQQQAMNDEQLKNMTTMNDEKRKDIKLQAQNQRQERAGQAKEAALAQKTQGDLQIKAAKVAGEHDIAKQKVQLDAVLKNHADQQAAADPSGYLNKMTNNGANTNPDSVKG